VYVAGLLFLNQFCVAFFILISVKTCGDQLQNLIKGNKNILQKCSFCNFHLQVNETSHGFMSEFIDVHEVHETAQVFIDITCNKLMQR
jgi:hypothetical protein